MGKCVIFCAGGFQSLARPVDSSDFLLAADGGLAHLQRLGLLPHGIIGDFDSLGYVPEGAQVFPVEKDDTDSMLAVRKGLELGYREFEIYGGLDGPRLDHTIANLQTLCFLAEHGATGCLVGETYVVGVVRNGTVRFPKAARGILSVFCFGEDAVGVNITGTHYELNDGTLQSGFPLGVSNHFTEKEAVLSVLSGTLIFLYDRANGLPQWEEPVC